MKFSEIKADQWPELQPYLDTCVLPVTGLAGGETPHDAADRAGRTGDWLVTLENRFHGRIVTYPAYHYYSGDPEDEARLAAVCRGIRAGGFRYVVLVCGTPGLLSAHLPADLVFQPSEADEEPDREETVRRVTALWRGETAGADRDA